MATIETMQTMRESFGKRITSIGVKVSDLEKIINGKLVIMEKKINDLQSQLTEQVRIVSNGADQLALMVASLYPYPNSNSRRYYKKLDKGRNLNVLSVKGRSFPKKLQSATRKAEIYFAPRNNKRANYQPSTQESSFN